MKLVARDAWRPKFDAEPLRAAILKIFDKDAKLGDALHPVLIPAVNLTQGQPQVFKTPHHTSFVRDKSLAVVDIAMATSAAPSFFPPARLGNNLYVDGGLYANTPDLVALHEATHFLRSPVEKIYMLSIGTTTTSYSIVDSPENQYGIAFWATGSDPRLANVLIAAQQQLAMQVVRHALGTRHFRIDSTPSQEQAGHLGLAIASEVATTTLRGLGEKSATDFFGNEAARALLEHEAQDLLLNSKDSDG
jgi:patatin-like phospholipase/acyl hydrolase